MKRVLCSFRKIQLLQYIGIGFVGSFFLLYLFYESCLVGIFGGIPGTFFFLKWKAKKLQQQRTWQLTIEFKDMMDSMISALVAGYSMENAVGEAYRDLTLMYDRDSPVLQELQDIQAKLQLKIPLDKLLLEFGRSSGVEDILTFAQIYATARKSGGNLARIMRRTARNIGEKMEIQREIQTMIAGKKMESMCMMIIPLLIILYMQIFSPGFLDPLYQGMAGRGFMTVALIVYGFAVWWSKKIMQIAC